MAEGGAPALPWGRATGSVPDKAPPLAVKIEVLWVLGEDDSDPGAGGGEGVSLPVWWPATVYRRAEGTVDGEGRLAYILRYDAIPEHGYDEPTEHTVSFMNEHELFDLGEEDLLPWRRVGDSWTPPQHAPHYAMHPTEGKVEVHSLAALAQEQNRIERLRGRTEAEVMAEMLNMVPRELQSGLVQGYLNYEQVMREEMAAVVATLPDGVLHIEHVQEVVRRVNERMNRGGAP